MAENPASWASGKVGARTYPIDFSRGQYYFFLTLGGCLLALAGFVVVGAGLSSTSAAHWILLLAIAGVLVVMGDRTVAGARIGGYPRSITISPEGISGRLLPPAYVRQNGDALEYRTPILRMRVSRLPLNGVPWGQVELYGLPDYYRAGPGNIVVWPIARSSSGVGGALDRGAAFHMTIPDFARVAEMARRSGGAVLLPRSRRLIRAGALAYSIDDGRWLHLKATVVASEIELLLSKP